MLHVEDKGKNLSLGSIIDISKYVLLHSDKMSPIISKHDGTLMIFTSVFPFISLRF
jgi:hypothetical protein